MGRGFNTLEWLTVKGNASAQAFSIIDTDLIWPGGTSQIKIAHCIVKGGRNGIDIRNINVASIGRVLEAELADNKVFENMVQQGVGILIQNANGATGAIIRASLHGNYVHGNKVGLRSFNSAGGTSTTTSTSISIESNADRFEENGLGLILAAALSDVPTSTSTDNSLVFEAHGTAIKNSTGSMPPETNPSCGIFAVGGFTLDNSHASNSRLTMNLWGCSISGNQGAADIIANGAFSFSPTPAGLNNSVEIHLYGVSKQATDISTASLPVESVGTNVVNIFR
jgi:hypothetical protein